MNAPIRPARRDDSEALTNIYNWYVEHGTATFDLDPATPDERARWLATFDATGPHQLVVAELDGHVAGYACSGQYRSHPAFSETVETSLYVHPERRGRGLGGRLYDALLERLMVTDVHLAVAAVALPNDASVALHRSRGFREVGTFTEYALKRGERLSSTWFERLMR